MRVGVGSREIQKLVFPKVPKVPKNKIKATFSRKTRPFHLVPFLIVVWQALYCGREAAASQFDCGLSRKHHRKSWQHGMRPTAVLVASIRRLDNHVSVWTEQRLAVQTLQKKARDLARKVQLAKQPWGQQQLQWTAGPLTA